MPVAEGAKQFDLIQSYDSNLAAGTMTLVTHGDTTSSLVIGVRSAQNYSLVTGTYSSTTKLTTYTSSNAARTDGVYIFNKNDVALLGTATLTDIQISKALKILKFDINPSSLDWANIT